VILRAESIGSELAAKCRGGRVGGRPRKASPGSESGRDWSSKERSARKCHAMRPLARR